MHKNVTHLFVTTILLCINQFIYSQVTIESSDPFTVEQGYNYNKLLETNDHVITYSTQWRGKGTNYLITKFSKKDLSVINKSIVAIDRTNYQKIIGVEIINNKIVVLLERFIKKLNKYEIRYQIIDENLNLSDTSKVLEINTQKTKFVNTTYKISKATNSILFKVCYKKSEYAEYKSRLSELDLANNSLSFDLKISDTLFNSDPIIPPKVYATNTTGLPWVMGISFSMDRKFNNFLDYGSTSKMVYYITKSKNSKSNTYNYFLNIIQKNTQDSTKLKLNIPNHFYLNNLIAIFDTSENQVFIGGFFEEKSDTLARSELPLSGGLGLNINFSTNEQNLNVVYNDMQKLSTIIGKKAATRSLIYYSKNIYTTANNKRTLVGEVLLESVYGSLQVEIIYDAILMINLDKTEGVNDIPPIPTSSLASLPEKYFYRKLNNSYSINNTIYIIAKTSIANTEVYDKNFDKDSVKSSRLLGIINDLNVIAYNTSNNILSKELSYSMPKKSSLIRNEEKNIEFLLDQTNTYDPSYFITYKRKEGFKLNKVSIK